MGANERARGRKRMGGEMDGRKRNLVSEGSKRSVYIRRPRLPDVLCVDRWRRVRHRGVVGLADVRVRVDGGGAQKRSEPNGGRCRRHLLCQTETKPHRPTVR
eukprot:6195306-Pleurochrysis_carterae.AAC.1